MITANFLNFKQKLSNLCYKLILLKQICLNELWFYHTTIIIINCLTSIFYLLGLFFN